LILIFGTVVGWDYLYGRFQQHDPYAGRREVAAATLTMVKASPAHGFGLGTWTAVYPAFASKDFGVFINAAHNDWLQWGSDGGVPMLACILALFAASLAMVRRAPWALGVPIVFVHCLIDFPMQGRFLPAVVFLVFGIAARAAIRREEEPSRPRRSRESLRQLTVSADAR
jgi:O-antigen ligase